MGKLNNLLAVFLFLLSYSALSASTNAALNCEASFSYELYIGSNPQVGGYLFTNLSEGDYTNVTWDFGDGNYNSDNTTDVIHYYTQSDSYEVTLSIWDDLGCNSSVTQTIEVLLTNDICEITDCVLPGDANGDGKANMFDLLNIGVGFGIEGPERPMATTEWVPQASPDWTHNTVQGINYKHLDCNGDGIVNSTDVFPILNEYVYSVIEQDPPTAESDSPLLFIDFDADTVTINESTTSLELNAAIMLGTQSNQVENIHGISFLLRYDSDFIQEEQIITINYNSSFIGNNEEVIALSMDVRDTEQLDVAITRTDAESRGGEGRLGTVNFIIIDDIIDGIRETEGDQFPVEILVVGANDEEGNPIEISTPLEDAFVVIEYETTVSTQSPSIDQFVKIYPQPVKDQLTIELQDLNNTSLSLYNAVGQRIINTQIKDNIHQLSTTAYQNGIYFMTLTSDEGQTTKRIIIENK